ncbi:translation initiation factor IF-2-like [Mustela erminea]|uniref:translation initiation factor IF-2-like n=1 Tax=Mustela erminea TaxID=36723 RepID=UPI001386AD3D|nr:translation initiation factor IF-2-like [Mustela erminea]
MLQARLERVSGQWGRLPSSQAWSVPSLGSPPAFLLVGEPEPDPGPRPQRTGLGRGRDREHGMQPAAPLERTPGAERCLSRILSLRPSPPATWEVMQASTSKEEGQRQNQTRRQAGRRTRGWTPGPGIVTGASPTEPPEAPGPRLLTRLRTEWPRCGRVQAETEETEGEKGLRPLGGAGHKPSCEPLGAGTVTQSPGSVPRRQAQKPRFPRCPGPSGGRGPSLRAWTFRSEANPRPAGAPLLRSRRAAPLSAAAGAKGTCGSPLL